MADQRALTVRDILDALKDADPDAPVLYEYGTDEEVPLAMTFAPNIKKVWAAPNEAGYEIRFSGEPLGDRKQAILLTSGVAPQG